MSSLRRRNDIYSTLYDCLTQLAFYVNLHRAVIGPSATLTGRWRPDIDLRRMLTGLVFGQIWDQWKSTQIGQRFHRCRLIIPYSNYPDQYLLVAKADACSYENFPVTLHGKWASARQNLHKRLVRLAETDQPARPRSLISLRLSHVLGTQVLL